jgi:hypothetical protein
MNEATCSHNSATHKFVLAALYVFAATSVALDKFTIYENENYDLFYILTNFKLFFFATKMEEIFRLIALERARKAMIMEDLCTF